MKYKVKLLLGNTRSYADLQSSLAFCFKVYFLPQRPEFFQNV